MRNKIWENIKRYVLPSIGGTLTFDSWLTSKRDSFKEKYVEQAIKNGEARERALNHSLREADKTVSELEVKATAVSDRIETTTNTVNELASNMNILNNQIRNGDMSPTDTACLETRLGYLKQMYDRAIQQQDSAIKELQTISSTNDPNIVRSSFSDLFYNLIDSYKDYISILTSEQLVILFNLIGYVSLTMTMTTITTLLIGDHLINYFKLQTRYPKLADYIKYKQTINRLYLGFYLGYFFFLIIVLITINIIMFTYDYL